MDIQVSLFQLFANIVLIAHIAFVLFVVFGLVLTLLGGVRSWAWVRNPRFRVLHLAAIAYVALESWLGIVCPLTSLELWLRGLAGQVVYEGDFIAYWLRKFLFFTAAPWVFTFSYSVFAVLVVVSWYYVRPRKFSRPD
ncbi:MAG: DUF2784 domain-containing protein [Undibacterium sp.]|nr:DUF2784 domain-containing protein [Undibacterium sp.]